MKHAGVCVRFWCSTRGLCREHVVFSIFSRRTYRFGERELLLCAYTWVCVAISMNVSSRRSMTHSPRSRR